jgi:hypothetical protein
MAANDKGRQLRWPYLSAELASHRYQASGRDAKRDGQSHALQQAFAWQASKAPGHYYRQAGHHGDNVGKGRSRQ